VLKKIGFVAAFAAGSLAVLGGTASADPSGDRGDRPGHDSTEQVGLLNLQNTQVLQDVEVPIGICNNSINILAISVQAHEVLEDIAVPILNPGGGDVDSVSPEHDSCTSNSEQGSTSDQGN
jgi:hypothetical protein